MMRTHRAGHGGRVVPETTNPRQLMSGAGPLWIR